MKGSRIGLALSGGGSRAIAFHLGCLRALNEVGILKEVEVISTVSGGSIIGALYVAYDESFSEFERRIYQVLSKGLVLPAMRKVFTSFEGVKVIYCWAVVLIWNTVATLLFMVDKLISSVFCVDKQFFQIKAFRNPVFRFASRTTILQRVLDDIFEGRRFNQLPSDRSQVIICATELSTNSAFYFSRKNSGSSKIGTLVDDDLSLSDAVAASVAYPTLLPALDKQYHFTGEEGCKRKERVILTDGGVYDNLGLTPLWPDRDSGISVNFIKLDSIICCNAGYGTRLESPKNSLVARLRRTIACIHMRAQNATMNRLFDLKKSAELKGFLLPYLGQDDNNLKYPPENLISREEVIGYPTDFCAMSPTWIDKLSRRGEQLTKALIAEHYPEILPVSKGKST